MLFIDLNQEQHIQLFNVFFLFLQHVTTITHYIIIFIF